MTKKRSGGVRFLIGEPSVVAQASPDVRGWGPYQFPRLERLADGSLHVAYHVEADSATAYGLACGHAVSRDDGLTWESVRTPGSPGGILLPDGSRFLADSVPSRPVAGLALPAPAAAVHSSYVDNTYYRVRDLSPDLVPGWPVLRLPAGERAWTRAWASVELGEEADVRVVTEDVLVTPFFEQDRVRLAPDGSLRATIYALPHLAPRGKVLRAYFVRVLGSADGGCSWRVIGAVPYRPDPDADSCWDARDGFTEPELHDLPDGSLLMLLRTHDGNGVGPLYEARSADGGATWSRPRVFDDRGVWPQLLTLGCGVTLAAYGRPGLFLRAAADPAGREWGARVPVPLAGAADGGTCSYADLIALDGRRALIVYSDFAFPDRAGRPCKTILARTVGIS